MHDHILPSVGPYGNSCAALHMPKEVPSHLSPINQNVSGYTSREALLIKPGWLDGFSEVGAPSRSTAWEMDEGFTGRFHRARK